MNPETQQLLRDMNAKMDVANAKLDDLKSTAAKSGAVAGGLAGGIVATAIMVIKAKLGL